MNLAASELVDIFFKEQFRGLDENPQHVIQNAAHKELAFHSMLLSSMRPEVRDEGLLHLVLMPAELQKSAEQQRVRMNELESRDDGASLLMAASIARELQDSATESRLLESAKARKSCMAGMQLGAKALECGDIRTALKHYRHSAILSNPIAQHKLGFLLEQPGEFHNATEAARFYLKAGSNGHPDSLYNLSLMVERGLVPCPEDWTVRALTDTAVARGSAAAKSSWVQSTIAEIDSLSALQLARLWEVAWDCYVEEPEVANHSFFLGCLYVPTAVRSDVPRPSDVAKALHFLKIAKRVSPEEARDSLLASILAACPVPPPETSPTLASLTQQAERRVLDFRVRQLRDGVLRWTEEPASPRLMAYCGASHSTRGGRGASSSSGPTNAVVLASLLSKSLSSDEAPVAEAKTLTPFAPAPAPPAPSSLNDPGDVKEKGAPRLVDMTSEEILPRIASFHSQRVQWGFATDPTDFPFRLPDISGTFSKESLELLVPVLADLMSPHNLDSLAGVVSTMQPHGALIALYLLEIPFFARDVNDWADDFPLADELLQLATNPPVAQACTAALCSAAGEVDVCTACLHLLSSCHHLCDDYDCKFPVDSFEEKLCGAVLSLLRRGSPSALSLECLVSCVSLLGGFTYTADLLASCGQDLSVIKILLHEAVDPASAHLHPDFNAPRLSQDMMSAVRRVVHDVIGTLSTPDTLACGKTELRKAMRRGGDEGGSGARKCALEGCSSRGAELKACSRCKRVGYCSVEHQKLDWKKHKEHCQRTE